MKALEAIFGRFSCRKFEKGEMKEEDKRSILEAGMSAPSAMNRRPYDLVLIEDPEVLRPLEKSKPTLALFYDNPLSVLIVIDEEKNPHPEFQEQDVAAVAENMLLAATALGYGSLWAGITENSDFQAGLAELFDIPEGHRPAILLSFGTKGEHKEERPSRYEEGKIHRGRW